MSNLLLQENGFPHKIWKPVDDPFNPDPLEGSGQYAWREIAAQHHRNEEFYRGIVVAIGELFGVVARTSDDGSVQDDVLALRVPELVSAHLLDAKRYRWVLPLLTGDDDAIASARLLLL